MIQSSMYWIIVEPEDALVESLLTQLGVVFNPPELTHGGHLEYKCCIVPDVTKLDKYWGRIIYGPVDVLDA